MIRSQNFYFTSEKFQYSHIVMMFGFLGISRLRSPVFRLFVPVLPGLANNNFFNFSSHFQPAVSSGIAENYFS